MESPLDAHQARVLACLVEKELATPEYYPLSLNALVLACNQRSNRDPVLDLSEQDVTRALAALRERQLALQASDGGRVAKYRHFLVEKADLSRPALAVLCELMLRGPQTAGELRTRASRMADLPDLEALHGALRSLESLHPPLAVLLPRRPGHKEPRYAHLLAGAPPDEGGAPAPARLQEPPPDAVEGRLARLEAEVATLREELDLLRKGRGDG